MRAYKQGRFKPTNPEKYKGNAENIIFRSDWERRIMCWMDTNKNILEWSSEEIIVLYRSPVDNSVRRYFPDIYMKYRLPSGELKETLLEIKPDVQTRPPVKPSRKTKKYLQEVVTYGINQAKWQAAEKYCSDRGWDFRVLTEHDLFPKRGK